MIFKRRNYSKEATISPAAGSFSSRSALATNGGSALRPPPVIHNLPDITKFNPNFREHCPPLFKILRMPLDLSNTYDTTIVVTVSSFNLVSCDFCC